MEIQQIDIYIAGDGTVRMEVRGVKGRRCLGLTEDIERLLGGMVASRETTPEYDDEGEAVADATSTVAQGW